MALRDVLLDARRDLIHRQRRQLRLIEGYHNLQRRAVERVKKCSLDDPMYMFWHKVAHYYYTCIMRIRYQP